jgi:putative membrane protein
LAIPLAALLATTRAVLDIVVWGIVALLLQLVTVVVASHVMRGLKLRIDDGSIAAALPITAAQLAIALLNAAGMIPV